MDAMDDKSLLALQAVLALVGLAPVDAERKELQGHADPLSGVTRFLALSTRMCGRGRVEAREGGSERLVHRLACLVIDEASGFVDNEKVVHWDRGQRHLAAAATGPPLRSEREQVS